ncbi:hypothetical protein Ddye_028964 [Dipteronia dyeriana]|uniref:Uncharacterized protein n=1 Tax=Dipteronia dyeriana TaxID=168575 RepID=A0AAD9WL23_9ROSI|nr:hypothetical protein Ddye_028964 [Dipteronia dyeriana]
MGIVPYPAQGHVYAKELIEQINSSDSNEITSVVADNLLGCDMEIAAEKGIKRAAFTYFCCSHTVGLKFKHP